MASDSPTDDAATRSLRQAVGKLLSGLSRAVFGVCAVAVGLIALFVGAGTTGDSAAVLLIVGIASLLVGFVTISRLPKPSKSTEGIETSTEIEAGSTAETPSSDTAAVDDDETATEDTDRHRQQAD